MQCASTTALLAGVVDYAGLFPPAGLPMAEAVAEYHAARSGAHAWMLGRFVAPAARLPELAAALATLPQGRPEWRVSAIVRDGSAADCAAVADFNNAFSRHHARVDTVEGRPTALDGIDWLAAEFGAGIDLYVEVAPGPDVERWFERLAARGLRAKVRTGGVTADAFPAPAALAAFLAAAVRHRVVFKATAGLHHAIRGGYRLTYERGAAKAPMYGYLNVLLAVATLQAGRPLATAEALLQRTDASTLAFETPPCAGGDDTFP
ncbi:MAG: hypothetical protein R2708_17480 [Vicinamibacterales bacterium]